MGKYDARLKAGSSFAVPNEAFAAALKRMRSMTREQKVKSLKDAGILTPKGNFSKPYQKVATA